MAGRARPWMWVAAVAFLVAVALLATLWRPSAPPRSATDVPTAHPSGEVWDELPIRSDGAHTPAAPPPRLSDVTDCPVVEEIRVSPYEAGFVVGGGLAFPSPDGWTPAREVSLALTDEQAVEQHYGATALRSAMTVGEVARADGFTTPEEVAWGVLFCHLESNRFHSNNMRYDTLVTEQREDGWRIRVSVRSIRSAAEGTVFDVVAHRTGDATFGVFMAVAVEAFGQADADIAAALDGLALRVR